MVRCGFREVRNGNAHELTWGVELPLLQERLVNHQGSIAGQLQEPADQAVGCVVFVRDELQMVHVLYRHLETKRLQQEVF